MSIDRADLHRPPTAIYRGPLLPAREVADVVCATWPQAQWPWAIAVAFAESGLEVTVMVDGRRRREWMVWSRTLGDLHLQTTKWGPSVGLFQLRQLASVQDQQWPLDPAANSTAAASLHAQFGPGRWASAKSGRHLAHMPRAHTALAEWWTANPKGPSK